MSESVLVGLKEAKGALRIWAEDGNLDNNDQQRVVPLARVLASWFVECDNCEGTGDEVETVPVGHFVHRPCPACDGRGFRWTPETIVRAKLAAMRAEEDAPPGLSLTERNNLKVEAALWSLFTTKEEE